MPATSGAASDQARDERHHRRYGHRKRRRVRRVTVNYVGVLYKGGKEFDASWKSQRTVHVPLGTGQVIPGWDQGIPGMKVGGRRELIIPASLAYGAKGAGASIPPNSALVFVVDLLAV